MDEEIETGTGLQITSITLFFGSRVFVAVPAMISCQFIDRSPAHPHVIQAASLASFFVCLFVCFVFITFDKAMKRIFNKQLYYNTSYT